MKSFNLKVVNRFLAIAKLYWLGNEGLGATVLIILLGLLLLANTGSKVFLNAQQGEWISALSKLDSQRFWRTVIVASAGIVFFGLINSAYGYLREKIGLYWRRWLTHYFLSKYFSDRTFYNLAHSQQELDNPDQRISEDIVSFCQQSIIFVANLLESTLTVIFFSNILWSISKNLVFALIIYSLLAYGITISFYGTKLTNLNIEQLKKEANFRFGLIRIRENAESIAFYNGINQEDNKVKTLFNHLFDNFKILILWSELYLNIFKYPFGNLTWVIPGVILANDVILGNLEVGKVVEAGGAFGTVAFSVNLIMYQFDKYTKFAASINRLYKFYQYLEHPKPQITEQSNIEIVTANHVSIKNLTLQTPNSKKTLFKNLNLELPSGQGLLVMGDSGCGKTSLLRALAGLWNSGEGVIFRPELTEIIFLPQRPYMILGSLREQLIYPHTQTNLSDQELCKILRQVNLEHLTTQYQSLDIEQDWSDTLSLGEQQRLAFARLLVNKPQYAILDESTSALDVKNEESLYNLLLETGITFISVGHRPTLKTFHQWVLVLSPNDILLSKTEN